MNVRMLFEKICIDLKESGINWFETEARIILEKVLNISKELIYTFPKKNVSLNEFFEIKKVIDRRILREPLEYILNETEFYGLKLYINNNVLVPRQETELIVERAILKIKENNFKTIADIGTGSGNIAISIANCCPETNIFAVDNFNEVLDVVKKNVFLYKLEKRIKIIKSNYLEYFKNKKIKLDLIISNPPYVISKEYESLQPEIYYEPITSLVCDEEVCSYKNIASNITKVLNKGAVLIVEINPRLKDKIKDIFLAKKLKLKEIIKDYKNTIIGLVFQN